MGNVAGDGGGGYRVNKLSSVAAIDAGQSWDSGWFPVDKYDAITTAVKTDQNGYYDIVFSVDQVNEDSTLRRYYRTSKINPPHRFVCARGFVKVVFYNTSASNQTFFRFETMLGIKGDLNAPLDTKLAQDFDSTAVRPSEFSDEVALGLREGVSKWNKFGEDTSISSGDGERTNWDFGGTMSVSTWLTANDTYDIAYNNTTDGSGGTGARSLRFFHVKIENGKRVGQVDDHTLGGTGTDTTSFSGVGLNRVQVLSQGGAGFNTNAITITDTSGGNAQGYIPATSSITWQSVFFTQSDHTTVVSHLHAWATKLSGGGSPNITVRAYYYSFDTGVRTRIFREVVDTSVRNHIDLDDPEKFTIPENSVLHFTAESDNSSSSSCGIRFSLKEYTDVDSEAP